MSTNTANDDSYNYEEDPILSREEQLNLERECTETVLSQHFSPDTGSVYCSATFDGWGCWNYTKAGERAVIKCPEFITKLLGPAPGKAFKDCTENGTWWVNPDTNLTWSNYTDCVGPYKVPMTYYINVSGGYISIALLIIAFAIFTRYSQLKCKRVTLHKNLFLSYILHTACWMAYLVVRREEVILLENPAWCQILHVVTWYFMETSYAWMFCEGFFLHTQIVVAFTNDKKLVKLCLLIGWVFPLVVTSIYALLKGLTPALTKRCWTAPGESLVAYWVLTGPIVFFVVVNLAFLINIMRILLSKLRARRSSDTSQTRSALRAALILIPLLGVQYFLVPVSLPRSSPAYTFFSQLSAFLSAYQGASVAILLCFINKEVIELVKRRYRQMLDTYWPSSRRSGSTSHSLSWFSSSTRKISHSLSIKKEDEIPDVVAKINGSDQNGHSV